MVLHFVIDEKVTDQIIENFSKADNESKFLVFVNNNLDNYKHLSSLNKNLISFNENDDDINSLLTILKPQAILMHAFHLEFARTILKIKNTLMVNIAWYTWGFDVYGLPRIKPKTYAVITNQFLLRRSPKLYLGRFILKHKLTRKIYFKLNRREEDRYSIIFEALKKVNFFVTYLKEDYDFFSKHYHNKLQFLYSPFSTIDQYLAGTKETSLYESANNILLGNSNSIESNHLDVFQILKSQKVHIDNAKIYTPLSYGEDIIYKQEVMNIGNLVLGNSFVPILDFMKRDDYITMLKSCSIGIFYHYRQQAMGNIISMLYLGARIYLSPKNPAYNFFIKNEIQVFDFEKDFKTYRNTKLDIETVKKNKEKLNNLFKESRVLNDIKNLIKDIT